uniref:Uncharacterized protein n=1 Tax=Knipowitschia caucasica TaxID=637954 RepID=A0AAV2JS65_KNICA
MVVAVPLLNVVDQTTELTGERSTTAHRGRYASTTGKRFSPTLCCFGLSFGNILGSKTREEDLHIEHYCHHACV